MGSTRPTTIKGVYTGTYRSHMGTSDTHKHAAEGWLELDLDSLNHMGIIEDHQIDQQIS